MAVIGVGFWGQNHARVFSELEETELVAVCDMNREKVKAASRRFGVKGYVRVGQLLRRKDLDAVSVCVWPSRLGEIALKVLQAGKHAFVEKPMAANTYLAQRLLNEAKKRELYLSTGFLLRFLPCIQKMKELIHSGDLGELVCLIAKRFSWRPQRIGALGVVRDLAIHDFDMARFLLETEPTRVYARIKKVVHKNLNDYAQVALLFKGGIDFFIEACWLTPPKVRTLTVIGDQKIAHLDYIKQEVSIKHEQEEIKLDIPKVKPLTLELEHFARCILKGEKPIITGEDGLHALRIAEAALKSSKTGKLVKL